MNENEIYDEGYNCKDGTLNPYPTATAEHGHWQRGYDESIINNAQNLAANHPDVLRLNCGQEWGVGSKVQVQQNDGPVTLTVQIIDNPIELDYDGTKVVKRLCAGTNEQGFPEPFFDTDVLQVVS